MASSRVGPVKRVLQLLATAVLCLPLFRFASQKLAPEPKVDRTTDEWKAREALIARAKVFVPNPPEISTLDLAHPWNDPHSPDSASVTECRYLGKPIGATTPKFDCRFANGDVVKVKYGRTPERHAEVAATRLLAALGFAADRTAMVPKIRCIGCPPYPFQTRMVAEWFFATPLYEWLFDTDTSREFEWVSVERKMPGRAIEVGEHEGWDWSELTLVDPRKGGASRAELDALRLTAMFLSHWDNKATNQRLVCEPGEGGGDPRAPCRSPLLMVQDVGATFGPTKVRHEKWAATPIWADPAGCVVSLENLPYKGGHFRPIQISEDGRVLLAGRLLQLSEAQIRTLFQTARFPDPKRGEPTGDVSEWVRTFQDKVRQIAERPACPPLSDNVR
jgi:hypothetical protein